MLEHKELFLILQAMLCFALVVRGAQRGCSPLQPFQIPAGCSIIEEGNVDLAPQQHQHPQHEPQLKHGTEEEKSNCSFGLAQQSQERVLLKV